MVSEDIDRPGFDLGEHAFMGNFGLAEKTRAFRS